MGVGAGWMEIYKIKQNNKLDIYPRIMGLDQEQTDLKSHTVDALLQLHVITADNRMLQHRKNIMRLEVSLNNYDMQMILWCEASPMLTPC